MRVLVGWTHGALFFFLGGGRRPWRAGEDRSPEGYREISWTPGSELSNATIVPQGDAAADITHREDKLILIPGNAVGTATPEGIPGARERLTHGALERPREPESQGLHMYSGHITRFSVAPRSPSKLGSVPQMVHRSSSSGCFVADTRYVCDYMYSGLI